MWLHKSRSISNRIERWKFSQNIYYNPKSNPYFSPKKNDQIQVDEFHYDRYDTFFYKVEDFKHLPFSKSIDKSDRYIRFQFTPFNNLNLIYFHYNNDAKNLYKYCLLAKNKDTYIATELNPNNIIRKYRIKYFYKSIYHQYLYYLDYDRRQSDNEITPYIQVWKDNKTKQVYGIVLNMMGKWGVFDNEIIEEKK